MNLRTTVFSLFIVSLSVGWAVAADLPTRSELVDERYTADRSRGLITLNKRYLELYQVELDIALEAKKLDEANAIKLNIKRLNDEIASLAKASVARMEDSSSDAGSDEFALLAGKKIEFPMFGAPDKDVALSFQKDGAAVWHGLGGTQVERSYKPTEKARTFVVWWAQRSAQLEYEITVSEDGRTAEVEKLGLGETVVAPVRSGK